MLTARFTEHDLKHLNILLKLLTNTNDYLKSSVLAFDLEAVKDFRDDLKNRLLGYETDSEDNSLNSSDFLTGIY